MPWIQLRLPASDANAEARSDALMDAGASAVTFLDAKDTPLFEPLPGETPLWADTLVIGLFDAETDMDGVLAYLSAVGNFGAELKQARTEILEDKDWEREWMDNFHPMRFGQRLWICPSWRDIPEPDAVNVMLDPGLAFGTGTHPTTALCLRWLDGLDLAGKTVIDYGCGSGILGIAALKLGAKRVIGVDIDPQALQASQENARRNGVEQQFELFLPQDRPQLQADVLVANILAGPLSELAADIASLVRPGGELALSGLLENQIDNLQQVYGQWFAMQQPEVQEEWARLSGIRQA